MTAATPSAEQVYVFAAASAQRSLWFLDQLVPRSSLYNLHFGTRLWSAVNVPALERSINEIVRRHESLRTAFKAVDGEPMQVVVPKLHVGLPVTDLGHLPEAEREDEAARIAGAEAHTPFDLSTWPLLRTRLLRCGNEDYIFLLTMHHIVCDFWSMQVFQEELATLYEAYRADRPSPLPDLPIQYADFAEWERGWLAGPAGRSHLAYWKSQLADLPVLQLPTDWPRPQVPSFSGAGHDFELPASVHAALLTVSQQENATLFMTMLAAFQVLLHRYTGQDDIVVGTPVANRNRAEVENLIGFFVNSLVLRTDLSGDPRFRDLLARVRTVALDAYTHQDLPFEQLVSELRPERGYGRNPLFQVHFQLLSEQEPETASELLAGEPMTTKIGTAKFDLALDLWEYPDAIFGHFEYSTDLFSEETVVRLERHFRRLLEGIAADPDQRISELPLLDADECQQILVEWNDTEVSYPRDRCLQQLFEAQVERTPDAVAVAFLHEELTYAELNRRANQLARCLRSRGVTPDLLVGICVERSLELAVGLLGVLKAGAAYVPLNPSDPSERLQHMLEDARPRVLLTQRHLLDTLPSTAPTPLCLDADWDEVGQFEDDNLDVDVSSLNLAYVIYTSGSTGKPKGVQVHHQAVCNHLLWMQSRFPLNETDRVLQKYPFNFDASVCEIFGPLLAGARLIVTEPSVHWDVSRFAELLEEHGVTVLDLVPSMLEALLDEPAFASCRSLRRVVSGGEVLTPELRNRFFARMDAELHNIYGPTEAAIGATSWTCLPRHSGRIVPIGHPGANTQIYILDADLRPVPVGVRGELYIAGGGLARGYLRQGGLTAEKFLPNPFSSRPGDRMYRTGDLARYAADGAIEYAGRVDDQVKVRGHRVELREIQGALAQHDSVEACSVVPIEDEFGHKRLVAHVVPVPDPPELWPSLGEYDVYDELLYYAMTHDDRRNRSYHTAIARAVDGKVVLDLGTGADAILARYCLEAGAERVYAVEVDEDAYRRAEALVASLGLAGGIRVIHGDSAEVELPEKVDVCVSEILGTIGSSEGVIPILNDARRFLKNTGLMIPRRCVTKIAPVSLPEPLWSAPRLAELPRTYVGQVFERMGRPFDLRLCIKNFPWENLLSLAEVFEDLDFSEFVEPESERDVRFTINRDARLDGLLLWLNLFPAEDASLDSLHQSLSWLPVFFPVFYPGLSVSTGDIIQARCARAVRQGSRLPDYLLEGVVTRRDGERIPFTYTSPHDTSAFRSNAFYDLLFEGMSGPLEQVEDSWMEESELELASKLRRFLQEQLPEYMIPSSFVMLDELPWTSTGKLDRRALAVESPSHRKLEGAYVAPVTEAEEIIAAAWRDVLNVGQVSVHDNFFDLGGDSLLIAQVRSRLEPLLGESISIIDLFRYPTVSSLAQHLDRGDPQTSLVRAAQDRARRQRGAIGHRQRQTRQGARHG
jgi:amino acid adenylation domain-containing protein